MTGAAMLNAERDTRGRNTASRTRVAKQLAESNLAKVRAYLMANRWCTQAEVAAATGLCIRACGNHIRTVKREWLRARAKGIS